MRELHDMKLYGYAIIAIGILGIIFHSLGLEFLDSYLLILIITILVVSLIFEILRRTISVNEAIVRTLMIFVGTVLYWFNLHLEGMLLLTVYGAAEILESVIERYAERRLKKLLEIIPRTVKVVKEGKVNIVDVNDVNEGDIVIVGRGERIPVDGVILDGEALIDESTITGEPRPKEIKLYDEVLAGGLVLTGAVKVKAIKPGSQSLVARTVELVEKYKKKKATIESTIQKFSRIYLSLMLVASAIAWIIIGYYKALIFIAVGCPSAFLVTIPATLLASVSVYSRKGIIVKGTKPIESASKTNVIAFDKTGTITLGRLELERIVLLRDSVSMDDILRYAASLEVYSSHPVAKAIIREAKKRNVKLLSASEVNERPALGVEGKVLGKHIFIGKVSDSTKKKLNILAEELEGKVITELRIDGEPYAILIFSDILDPKSKAVIEQLKNMKFKVIMITGDKKVNAEKIAKQLGIDEYYAELKPEEKVRIIEKIKENRRNRVIMVGDGINDAPALAAANLGIAIGSLEAVGEAGDIVISRGSIDLVPFIVKFAKYSMRKVYENIAIILAAKLAAIVLSVIGFLPLWAAVALGDDGGALASLINIANILKSAYRS